MPLPRLAMNVRTRSAAAGVREIVMRWCPRALAAGKILHRRPGRAGPVPGRGAYCILQREQPPEFGRRARPAPGRLPASPRPPAGRDPGPAQASASPRSGGQDVRTAKRLEAGFGHPIALDPERERDLGALLPVARAALQRPASSGRSPQRRQGMQAAPNLGAVPRIVVTRRAGPERGSPARAGDLGTQSGPPARSTSAAVVKRPRLNRSELWASRSLRPSARST